MPDNHSVTMYGILLDGELVKCTRHRNRAAYCVPETFVIEYPGTEPWLVEDLNTALAVREDDYMPPDWYNADRNHPLVEIDLAYGRVVRVVTTTVFLDVQEELENGER